MSVGSQALERSALEAKDRESLLQIATAMGGKPGSRAKKADIVDMILELAGVTAPSAPAPADAPAAEAAPASGARKRAARTKADAENAEDGEPSAAATEVAAAIAAVAQGDDARPANGSQPQLDLDRAEASDARNGARDTATADRGGAVVRHQEGRQTGTGQAAPPAAQNRGGQGNQGGQNQGGQNQGAQGNQGAQNQGGQGARDEETGNRRRRRRGRDRDRPEGGQGQPAGQGSGQQGGQGGQGGQPQGQAPAEEPFVGEPVEVAGLLDLRDEGYGFLRLKGYLPSKDDVYVSVKQVRQFGLRKGDHLKGAARPASRNEKNPALLRIDEVNDADPELNRTRARFEELTPLFPDTALTLEIEGAPDALTARVIDLVAPIGKGQRGLILSPPKAGKTTVLQDVARSIETNHPDVHLIVLLVDERPEEVTDMRRHVQAGEVVASTFDRPAEEHTMVAELALDRAKRLVEEGKDVVIVLDGLTRLARAYHATAPSGGRTGAGGVDSAALHPTKRFFGAARNVEEGGSLTILATALVETGSKVDEAILEELEGTATMELRLDRDLAERRLYPAVDIAGSSTKHEDRLVEPDRLQAAWALRRQLHTVADEGGAPAGLEALVSRLTSSKTNKALLAEVQK